VTLQEDSPLRKLLVLLALSSLMAFAAPPASVAAAPYHLDIMVSETGTGAFLGGQEKQALTILQKLVNDQGGINGQPVVFDFVDDQSNPVVAVQLANGVIARGASVILGPSLVGSCAAIVPLVAKSGPVHYCFSNALKAPPGGFSFSASAGAAADAVVIVRYFRERGWTRLGFIAANDVSGHESQKQVEDALALPENHGVTLVDSELFNPGDFSVAAQIVRIKQQQPQAVFTTASGTVFGAIVLAMRNAGLDVPTYSSAANMVQAQLDQYGPSLPEQLYFAAPAGILPETDIPDGPIRSALNAYFGAFKTAGLSPSNSATLCWDSTLLVIDALRHAGPNPTPEKLHDYIEGLKGWAGIEGFYDFHTFTQRGIGEESLIVYRWDAANHRLVISSRRAGKLS
jgi:branched-chain amino acid transport system substrate-binding protein